MMLILPFLVYINRAYEIDVYKFLKIFNVLKLKMQFQNNIKIIFQLNGKRINHQNYICLYVCIKKKQTLKE